MKEKTYGDPLTDMLSIVILEGLEYNFCAVHRLAAFGWWRRTVSRRGTKWSKVASAVLISLSVDSQIIN
jgi:hypothetical protein